MLKSKYYAIAIAFLIISELILNAYIIYTDGANSFLCNSFSFSCLSVQNSQYGMLFGMKVSLFGIVSFILLFLLFISSLYSNKMRSIFLFAVFIGAFFAAYFIAIQIFVLHQLCTICMIIDLIMILILLLAILWWHKSVRQKFNNSLISG